MRITGPADATAEDHEEHDALTSTSSCHAIADFYDEHGAARRPGDPTIVLLHGLLFDGGMWREQLEALASLGRVIVMDGPGHGKSEPPPRFMMEEHADALQDAFGECERARVHHVVNTKRAEIVALGLATGSGEHLSTGAECKRNCRQPDTACASMD